MSDFGLVGHAHIMHVPRPLAKTRRLERSAADSLVYPAHSLQLRPIRIYVLDFACAVIRPTRKCFPFFTSAPFKRTEVTFKDFKH